MCIDSQIYDRVAEYIQSAAFHIDNQQDEQELSPLPQQHQITTEQKTISTQRPSLLDDVLGNIFQDSESDDEQGQSPNSTIEQHHPIYKEIPTEIQSSEEDDNDEYYDARSIISATPSVNERAQYFYNELEAQRLRYLEGVLESTICTIERAITKAAALRTSFSSGYVEELVGDECLDTTMIVYAPSIRLENIRAMKKEERSWWGVGKQKATRDSEQHLFKDEREKKMADFAVFQDFRKVGLKEWLRGFGKSLLCKANVA